MNESNGSAPHRVVIVGGGAGGLELAPRLGDTLGRRGKAEITLIERKHSHVWKPKLHEIAAGSMDFGDHEVGYLAHAHRHGFRFRIGEMTGIDRARREVHVAPFTDRSGTELTPARSFPYDTLVIAVGSQSNDFGTPGVREHALKLETAGDARRFHKRMVHACVRARTQRTPLRPEQLKVAIVGPMLGGTLLALNLPLEQNFMAFAIPGLVAAAAVSLVSRSAEHAPDEEKDLAFAAETGMLEPD